VTVTPEEEPPPAPAPAPVATATVTSLSRLSSLSRLDTGTEDPAPPAVPHTYPCWVATGHGVYTRDDGDAAMPTVTLHATEETPAPTPPTPTTPTTPNSTLTSPTSTPSDLTSPTTTLPTEDRTPPVSWEALLSWNARSGGARVSNALSKAGAYTRPLISST